MRWDHETTLHARALLYQHFTERGQSEEAERYRRRAVSYSETYQQN